MSSVDIPNTAQVGDGTNTTGNGNATPTFRRSLLRADGLAAGDTQKPTTRAKEGISYLTLEWLPGGSPGKREVTRAADMTLHPVFRAEKPREEHWTTSTAPGSRTPQL